MPSNPTTWILADDKAGNVNQCLGVAEALGWAFTRKNIVYNAWSALPNFIRNKTLIGMDLEKSDGFDAPYPDVVIAAGRRTAPMAAYIKHKNPACFVVQLMWPGYPVKDIDLIAIPQHDGRVTKSTRCLTTIGAPHRVTVTLLKEAATRWKNHFAALPAPYMALIVGGTTKYGAFTPEHAALLGKQASEMAAARGGSLLVTTSRRTDKAAEDALRQAINVPHFFYNGETGGDNPYFGFLALSDLIIVTGDSMSMCSEACAAGKPVMIFSPLTIVSSKHQRLHDALYASGYAAPFPSNTIPAPQGALNSADAIAAAIKARFTY